MKNFFNIIFLILLLVSCVNKPHADGKIHFVNVDCVIVEKMPMVPAGNHGSKAFLIRSTKDTNMYCEFIDLNNYYMDDSIYYKYNVGDTLHFNYIKKSRFFRK